MIKPGYKTSEFWFTLVSFVFSGLFLLGLIGDPGQKEELIENVSHAVESTILISGQLLVLYQYIKRRSDIKSKSLDERANNERTRKTSTKSRKPNSRK